MAYIEGFVVAVPAANEEIYRQHAVTVAAILKEHGVGRMVEAWGDEVPDGKITDFRRAVKAKDDEVIVFSWFEYPSKQARDTANAKMMSDPRMKEMGSTMPFDGQRMIYGGFKSMIDERAEGEVGYIDGSLVPVPTANKDAYHTQAVQQVAVLMEYGAIRVVDAWGDDVPNGKVTDYKGAVKAEDGEQVVYTWIEWPSKEVRDAGWQKVMTDPRMFPESTPYDNMRRVYGGFRPILDT
ncbi:MAG: DUF1428 domain-containing protein [Phyllobacterium sp.]